MKKYQTEFKLKVVKGLWLGTAGQSCWLDSGQCPRRTPYLTSHYRLHGIDGLLPKRCRYSAQFKLQVLSHQDCKQLSSR